MSKYILNATIIILERSVQDFLKTLYKPLESIDKLKYGNITRSQGFS